MALKFGNRPFDFSDFFDLIMKGEIDFGNLNYVDVMKKSIEAGFKHIEITGDLPLVLPGILSEEDIENMVQIKEQKGITYSVHLPLWGMEPAAFSEDIRNGSVEAFAKCIELTKPLDPVCWVIHPTGALTVEFLHMNLPDIVKQMIIEQFVGFTKESMEKLLKKTKIASRKLAVESIEFPFEYMEETIKSLDLSICLDTGHILAGYSGDISVLDFIDKYYDHIIELHLHDGKKPGIDHKPLGTHDLPVKDFLLKLKKKKFDGPIVYELNLQQAVDSMNYIRKIAPEVLRT